MEGFSASQSIFPCLPGDLKMDGWMVFFPDLEHIFFFRATEDILAKDRKISIGRSLRFVISSVPGLSLRHLVSLDQRCVCPSSAETIHLPVMFRGFHSLQHEKYPDFPEQILEYHQEL